MGEFYLQFWKLWKAVRWLFESQNDRWLHPPWIYSLYQKAFRERNIREEWLEFEALRKQLCKSQQEIRFLDPSSGLEQVRTIGQQATRTLLSKGGAQFLSVLTDHASCCAVLELGSSLGISALYLARKNRPVVTIEGAAPIANEARAAFQQFPDLDITLLEGRFDEMLPKAFELLNAIPGKQPILVWLDGHHEGKATNKYIDAIVNQFGTRAIFVLDDIRWSSGMFNAWQQQVHNPHWKIKIDLHRMGVLLAETNLSPGTFRLRPPLKYIFSFR